MLHDLVFDLVGRVARSVDTLLWHTYHACLEHDTKRLPSALYFVNRSESRKGVPQLRVSEQEARFAFVRELENNCRLLYAVERPTERLYCQSGESSTKASFDLGIFDQSGELAANVEFKAGGISDRARSTARISKDLEKLLLDPGPAVWFHILEAVDNSTLGNLLKVIAMIAASICSGNTVDDKSFLLHFTVLRQRFSIQRVVQTRTFVEEVEEAQESLQVKYRVTRDVLQTAGSANKWSFHHGGQVRSGTSK